MHLRGAWSDQLSSYLLDEIRKWLHKRQNCSILKVVQSNGVFFVLLASRRCYKPQVLGERTQGQPYGRPASELHQADDIQD